MRRRWQPGNENVLRARFKDAQFFYAEDRQQPLADFRPALAGITFQTALGSMLDKSVSTSSGYFPTALLYRGCPSPLVARRP